MRRPFCTSSSFNALSSSRPPSMICNFSGRHKSICFFAQTLTDLGRLVHSPCIISTGGASWVVCLRLLLLDENLWKNWEEYKKITTQINYYIMFNYIFKWIWSTYIVGLVSVAMERSFIIGMMKLCANFTKCNQDQKYWMLNFSQGL